MTKLGLSSYAYRWSIGAKGFQPSRPLSPRDLVQIAAGHGYSGVQLCDHLALPAPGSIEARELKETASQLGVYLELGARSVDPGYLRRLLSLAEALEIRLVRAVAEVDRGRNAETVEAQVGRLTDDVRAILPALADAGVRLALENHVSLRAGELRGLVERIGSERVGVCLDTMNSVVLLERPLETVTMLAPLAFCVHLKDFVVKPDPRSHRIVGTAVGEGIVPFAEILACLRREAPNASCHVELFIDRLDTEEATRSAEDAGVVKSLRYAREHLGFA